MTSFTVPHITPTHHKNSLAEDLKGYIQSGNLSAFKKTLEHVDFDKFNFDDIPWYESGEHLQYAQALFEAGLDPNKLLSKGKNSLHLAAESGNVDLVNHLLTSDNLQTNVNVLSLEGQTALHYIVQHEYTEQHRKCFNLLLDHHDILPNTTDRSGKTPLLLANDKSDNEVEARYRYGKYIKAIIDKFKSHIDYDQKMNDKMETTRKSLQRNFTVLSSELPKSTKEPTNEHRELIGLLEQRDDEKFRHCIMQAVQAVRRVTFINRGDDEGWTLLQRACHLGAILPVKVLIELGADVNVTNSSNKAPLRLACDRGCVSVVEMLLATNNIRFDINGQNETLIHVLAQVGCNDTDFSQFVEAKLEEYSEQVNAGDALKRTPLHYAIMNDNQNRTLELLNHEARVDSQDDRKQKPIDMISYETLKAFLDSKVTTNGCNPNDKHYQVYFDYSKLLRQQSELKANYDFPTDVLNDINRNKQLKRLLTHPILSYIIFIKWKFLTFVVYMNMLVYVLFAGSLTSYILLGAHQLGQEESTYIMLIVSYTFLGLLLLFELFYLFGKPNIYVRNLESMFRVLVLVAGVLVLVLDCSAASFIKTDECVSTYDCLQYYGCPHISALAMMLVWFELFFILGKIPPLTFYVNIFRSAFLLMLRFLCIHIPIILGFALSFNVLFSSDTTPDSPFSNAATSLFKTVIMLTGEFDAGDIPFTLRPVTSHLVFILFICTIAIVLFNLLIGLAASATKDIENKPFEYECRAQVWLIRRFELIFFTKKNIVQIFLHKLFWNKLCQMLLNVTYGKREDIRKYMISEKPYMLDFIVSFKPNENNQVCSSFFFFMHKEGGLVAKKSNNTDNFIMPSVIVKAAEKVIAEKSLKTITDEIMDIKQNLENLHAKNDQVLALLNQLVAKRKQGVESSQL